MKAVPAQKPGRSVQVVCTPPIFLDAVRCLLEIRDFTIDLAASADNAVCPTYYDEARNALIQPWRVGEGWAWCNPPFGDLRPWVQKAATEAEDFGAHVAMLVPAGVGSNWWRDYVHDVATVMLLNGRLTFVGHTAPYPKDCALLLYGPSAVHRARPAYDVWRWMDDVPR